MLRISRRYRSKKAKDTIINEGANYFGDLPNELILYIIHFLDQQDIWSLSCASTRFRTLCEDEQLWKQKCSLKFNCKASSAAHWAQHYKVVWQSSLALPNWEEDTALHMEVYSAPTKGFCYNNCLIRVKSLLEHGNHIDAPNRYGDTPLHVAAAEGKTELIEILLLCGASVHSLNLARDTPLHRAVRHGRYESSKLLLEWGARLNFGNPDTPFHWAVREGHESLAEFLLEWGADVNARNERDETPLHWAASSGQYKLARKLVKLGSNTNAKDISGFSAQYSASVRGYFDVASFLSKKSTPPLRL